MDDQKRKRISRREIIGALSAAGAVALAGACGAASPATPTTTTGTTTGTDTGGTTSGACAGTNAETEGPYPDRTGMINNPAFYRQDITEGKPGTPLTLALTVVSVANGCAAVANATIEVWQCDGAGAYSEYTTPGTFLRGLQKTDVTGKATFNTLYPGWYAGRATHIHVKVHTGGRVVHTGQLYFDEALNDAVYRTPLYSGRTGKRTTNAADGIYRVGGAQSMLAVTPDGDGYVGAITLVVA
jgi:protocatechuate 3,4-dioxygenase beta subunit